MPSMVFKKADAVNVQEVEYALHPYLNHRMAWEKVYGALSMPDRKPITIRPTPPALPRLYPRKHGYVYRQPTAIDKACTSDKVHSALEIRRFRNRLNGGDKDEVLRTALGKQKFDETGHQLPKNHYLWHVLCKRAPDRATSLKILAAKECSIAKYQATEEYRIGKEMVNEFRDRHDRRIDAERRVQKKLRAMDKRKNKGHW